jgi:hypothetical protein
MSSTGASAGDRLLSRVQLVTAKRPNEVTMDLEKIIDELVYRKKKLDLDSPERQLINRILTGLRYHAKTPAALSRIWISIGALLSVLLTTRNHRGQRTR